MSTTHLFLFTIGPVQSFIAQARKTSDLYAGSRILSELISTAINTFTQEGGLVIFPYDKNEAKPNRFLGKITDASDLKKLGQAVENAVKNEFRKMAEKACDHAKVTVLPAGFNEQVEQHLEIFWLFQEIETNYIDAYHEIEKNMGAIKNIRKFNQLPERGRKCTVDGEKNALFYRKRENNTEPVFLNRNAVELTSVDDVTFAKGEALSAIGLIKRFYYRTSFPSTAHIALLDIVHKLENLPEFNLYKKLFKEKWDERFLYEENFTEKEIGKNITEVKSAYRDLSSIIKKNGLSLQKYYAVLVFDGDSMGKILSGEFLADKQNLEEYQKFLSKLLGEFAKYATDYVDTFSRGCTIYAGGDDFMGFINLAHLFDVLKELRENFKEKVNKPLQQKYPLMKNNTRFDFTFSAGIAIAHYKTPLGVVLKTAKKMEDKAKEFHKDKNAFGVAVLKHSGEQHEMVIQWGQNAENLDRMKYIIDELNSHFSDTWIKNIEKEFFLLQEDNHQIGNKEDNDIKNMFDYELKRLLHRSNMYGQKEKTEKLYVETNNVFYSLNQNFEKFRQFLSVCQFITRTIK
jgi:CRISPR-associated protein Cmr2